MIKLLLFYPLSSVTSQKINLSAHPKFSRFRTKMPDKYSHCMISLVSFLDNTEYADNTAYSPEWLAQVTDVDVYRYLANKAFGTPEPSEDDLSDRCRSTTIKFHKKAISHFMPWRRQVHVFVPALSTNKSSRFLRQCTTVSSTTVVAVAVVAARRPGGSGGGRWRWWKTIYRRKRPATRALMVA